MIPAFLLWESLQQPWLLLWKHCPRVRVLCRGHIHLLWGYKRSLANVISVVTRFSKGATISSILSTKPSLVATGLTCSFVTVFWNRWPLNRCQWEGNTRAHYTLGLEMALKTGPHGLYQLQCFLETTQWTTVPYPYVPSLWLNPRQKQCEYSCGVFRREP